MVGFGGLLSGACVFRSGSSTAIRIAALMTGMEFDEMDDTVKDAIGEIWQHAGRSLEGKGSRSWRPIAGSPCRP